MIRLQPQDKTPEMRENIRRILDGETLCWHYTTSDALPKIIKAAEINVLDGNWFTTERHFCRMASFGYREPTGELTVFSSPADFANRTGFGLRRIGVRYPDVVWSYEGGPHERESDNFFVFASVAPIPASKWTAVQQLENETWINNGQ